MTTRLGPITGDTMPTNKGPRGTAKCGWCIGPLGAILPHCGRGCPCPCPTTIRRAA